MSDGKPLVNVRKAFASKGDDTTLSRFVKIPGERKHRKLQPRFDGIGTPAYVEEGRTKFPKSVDMHPNMLVTGHSNVKIGRDVRKGRFRGYWIYTLSLEERATCPRSCAHWQTCYGNNMPFAHRQDHEAPDFFARLEAEIVQKLSVRGRTGVLVRLHALGDFFSSEYVHFWMRMLAQHPKLAVFGYTAWRQATTVPRFLDPIGNSVAQMNNLFGDRSMIRFSNDERQATMSTRTYSREIPAGAFACPEQTGKTQCCATCGACWSTTKNVAFQEH